MLALNDPINQRNFFSLTHYLTLFRDGNLLNLLRVVWDYLLPGALPLYVFGLGCLVAWRRAEYRLFWAWLGAVALYFVVDPYPVSIQIHHYYFINLVPLMGVFFAIGAVSLLRSYAVNIVEVDSDRDHGFSQKVFRFGLPILALLAGMQLFYLSTRTYQDLANKTHHDTYYDLRDQLFSTVEDGAKIVQFAESRCPLLAYLLNDRKTQFGKLIRHRVAGIQVESLTQVLEKDDFNYLLLTWHTSRFPLAYSREEIASAGLGTPILTGEYFDLYRNQ